MLGWLHSEPAPPAFGEGSVLPEGNASWLSRLGIFWLSPLLKVGYSRPLQQEDLWQLPSERHAETMTKHFEAHLYSRYPVEERPCHLRNLPSAKTYDRSLWRALYTAYRFRWYLAGALRLIAAVTPILAALVTRAFLTWLTAVHAWHTSTEAQRQEMHPPEGVGYGFGLVLVLFVMQEVASLVQTHYVILTMVTGMTIRTVIVNLLFRKSLRLSNKAAVDNSLGRFTTMISVDCTALETSCQYFHNTWVTPVVIIVGVGLLVSNLGYSALVGLAVLLLGIPLQSMIMKTMYKQRLKGVAVTDERIRLMNEVLQGIRLIKYYAWEPYFSGRLRDYRSKEIDALRRSSFAQSMSAAILAFTPVLAAVLTFVTYSATGHTLEVATVFASLQIFTTIRTPLAIMMIVIRAMLGGHVALKRANAYLSAEDAEPGYTVDGGAPDAVNVDASFTWESTGDKDHTSAAGKDASRKDFAKKRFRVPSGMLPTSTPDTPIPLQAEPQEEVPFMLSNFQMKVSRGAFVAIVGKIGSGKSSLLQGMIGGMRRTRGTVTVAGPVAYVPQVPWIMNATLQENITFGLDYDEEKFQRVIRDCALSRDMDAFPNGVETEIGERGVGLSGGQRARVSLARAAYADADILLLDDCLSAVDAQTSSALVRDCLLHGVMESKTRVLVTHAIHVLEHTDYIYVMDDGRIVEHGTYDHLRSSGPVLSKLLEEYGTQGIDFINNGDPVEIEVSQENADKNIAPKSTTALMQAEERQTGGVTWEVCLAYLRFGGGVFWAVIVFVLLLLAQGAQVGNNLFLAFWTAESIHGFKQGDYMALYSGLGVAQAVMTFAVSFTVCLVGLSAGENIFMAALKGVLYSPTSFFDTTPIGRIISRLSQDQYTIDSELPVNQFELLTLLMTLVGTVGLVFYTIPLLGIIFAPLAIFYHISSTYYRRSMVESRRLDSLLRSGLYSTLAETFTGKSSVRAYRQEDRFAQVAQQRLDLQNRAKWLTVFIQRWLSLRLDLTGNLLLLGIGLYAAGQRLQVDPGKIGVILSYSVSITATLNELVYLVGLTEQNMNSVERMVHYAALPEEGSTVIKTRIVPPSWPPAGALSFRNVNFAYRPGLPLVLKGVSFSIKPAEKVGIVGRTGAGKSSILQAIFRMAEVQSGSIEIDAINTRSIDLSDLRARVSLVPQESVLFMGTLRENLDPNNQHTDATLIQALRRAHLHPPAESGVASDPKFDLKARIGEEGSNYSVGEKQSMALARALVKNSRIVVLDEATSSVDAETDTKLQRTIRTEFATSTILCIAHRLNTIAWYDRILVMHDGQVAEFDTPLNLYDAGGIFRSLCAEASLSREDITRIKGSVVVDHESEN